WWSVLENVLVGGHGQGRGVHERDALDILDYVGLTRQARRPAASLPYGTQKRVEIARALAARPRLLLLDEPAGGLNHEEVAALGGFIRAVRDERELAGLLGGHPLNLVMSISHPVTVLSFRRKDRHGPPAQLPARPE